MKTNSQPPESIRRSQRLTNCPAQGRLRAASGSAWTLIETCVVLAIIGLLVALIWSVHYEESVQMPAAFAAWVKQTGNEKHLTYEEWRSLMRANEKQNDTTIIFVPH